MFTRFLLLLGLGISRSLVAQPLYRPEPRGQLTVSVAGGMANYLGDLNGRRPLRRVDTGGGFSGAITYRFTSRLSARSELHLYQLRGSEERTPYASDNLSFQSYNPELSVGLVIDLLPTPVKSAVYPYLTVGGGLTYLTPKARYQNRWTSLAPLHTEGVAYSRTAALAYGGVGVAIRLPHRLTLGLEVAYQLTSSDYLDDVSTVYPAASALRSPEAAALSDRRPELGLPAHSPGDRRGNSAGKDAYLTGMLRLGFRLPSATERRYERQMRCLP